MAKKRRTITAKQKAARRKNMAIARKARSRYSKAKSILRDVGRKRTTVGGRNFQAASVQGKSRRGGLIVETMGHTRSITNRLRKANLKFQRKGSTIRIL